MEPCLLAGAELHCSDEGIRTREDHESSELESFLALLTAEEGHDPWFVGHEQHLNIRIRGMSKVCCRTTLSISWNDPMLSSLQAEHERRPFQRSSCIAAAANGRHLMESHMSLVELHRDQEGDEVGVMRGGGSSKSPLEETPYSWVQDSSLDESSYAD